MYGVRYAIRDDDISSLRHETIELENYIINNDILGDNDNIITMTLSSLIVIVTENGSSITYDDFIRNTYMFSDYEFSIDHRTGALCIELTDKIPITDINSDYTIGEIYEIYRDIYAEKLLS